MDLYRRQRGICPTREFQEQTFIVIGVGAVGHEVSMQLAAMGATKVHLVDFDRVEDHNCLSQGYLTSDVEKTKVDATALLMQSVTPRGMLIEEHDCKVQAAENLPKSAVWFSCPDSIGARKATYFRYQKEQGAALFDARVLGETIRICTTHRSADPEQYKGTLFADEEAVRGNCHSQMIMFGARIGASLLVREMTAWLRGIEIVPDMTFNLMSRDLYVPATV